MKSLSDIISTTDKYNFHTHTQFCDGKSTMEDMASYSCDAGLEFLGFTPHSPINIESPCNMRFDSVDEYLAETNCLKEIYCGRMEILTSMEIDFLSPDFGPHIDYFQKLPLDYRLGSVHFVPTQEGYLVDCDGRAEKFLKNLKEHYNNDLRYVVEKYFEQVLTMLEYGGIDILGHLDKIAQNASVVDPDIENQAWYEALIDDVISHAESSDTILEINTKYYSDKNRFFPHIKWWDKLHKCGCPAVNSDAHYADRINADRNKALTLLINYLKPEKQS